MSNKKKDAEGTNYNCWNEFSAVWSAKDSGLSVPIAPSEREWSISVSWVHPYYITEPKVLTGLLVGLPNKDFLCEELRWVRLMLCRKGETLGTRQIPCSVVTTDYSLCKEAQQCTKLSPFGTTEMNQSYLFGVLYPDLFGTPASGYLLISSEFTVPS